MIGLAEADVISVFIQAILFGLYLASLAHCLRWQLVDHEGWRLRTKINWAMLTIAILLFLFLTIDLAIRFSLTISAVQGDVRYFKSSGLAVTVLECSAMLVADGVLIYRCWVVYARSWRIVCLPIFFWILLVASTIICTFYLTPLINVKNEESFFHALMLEYYFWIIFYCASIITNIYATSAIVLRILKVAKGIGGSNSTKRLYRVSRIIAESGILYTATSVLSLVGAITAPWLELTLFNFSNLTSVLNFSMAGITFNLILIRIAQDRPNETCTESQRSTSGGVLSTVPFHPHFTTTIRESMSRKMPQASSDVRGASTSGQSSFFAFVRSDDNLDAMAN